VHAGGMGLWLAGRALRMSGPVGQWLASLAVGRAQRRAERLHARMRRDLLRQDEHLESALAFAGRSE
jgi:preprotein translocase subunit SecA